MFICGPYSFWEISANYQYRQQINADSTFLNSFSEKVLSAVFEASGTLGAGFLEKVLLAVQILESEARL